MATNPNPPTRGDSWGISSLPSGPTLPCLCWNKQRDRRQGAQSHSLPLAEGQVHRTQRKPFPTPEERSRVPVAGSPIGGKWGGPWPLQRP